jgi:hypothetical protein
MVAPSAVKQLGSRMNICSLQLENVNDLNVIEPHLKWLAHIKHWPNIPFGLYNSGDRERLIDIPVRRRHVLTVFSVSPW